TGKYLQPEVTAVPLGTSRGLKWKEHRCLPPPTIFVFFLPGFGKNRKDERQGDRIERKGSSKNKMEETQVTEEETQRMRLEQERIQAKTRELRERQAKEQDYAEIQDIRTFSSDEEHTYAGIGSLDSSLNSSTDLSQNPPAPESPRDQPLPLESLYAQVNKPRNGRTHSTDSHSKYYSFHQLSISTPHDNHPPRPPRHLVTTQITGVFVSRMFLKKAGPK
ncbi:putative partitioning defective 3-like protein, partial [Triplophysa rosa]